MKIDAHSHLKSLVSKAESFRPDRDRLEKASRDFESIILGQFFRIMHSTVGRDGAVGRSFQRGICEEMLQNEFAKVFAARGGFNMHGVLVDRLGGGNEAGRRSRSVHRGARARKLIEKKGLQTKHASIHESRKFLELGRDVDGGGVYHVEFSPMKSFRKLNR